MSKVSIVMSTYNRTHSLPRAIKSILEQTFKDWDLTIIDDCSTDGTKIFLSRIASRIATEIPMVVIFNKQNLGSLCKNKYMLEARGDYIAILDDDDQWEPTYLEELVKALDENSQYGLAYCDAYRVDEKNNVRYWDSSKGKPFPNILPSCCQ